MCAHLVEGLGVTVAEGLGVPHGLPSITSWESEAPGDSEVGLTRMHAVASYSSHRWQADSQGLSAALGWAVSSSSPCPLCTYQLIGVLGPGQVAHL